MGKNTSYGLAVVLSDADASAITGYPAGAPEVNAKLNAVAGGLLRDLAKGGIMIPPEWADRIEAAIQSTEPAAIVEHVEKSVGRQGEALIVPWHIDPTQIAFYQSIADSNGIPLAQHLKSVMDYAFSQGWINVAAPDPRKLLFSSEDYRWLQQLCEKDNITGADVIEKLHKAGAIPAVVAEDDDDVVLASLQG